MALWRGDALANVRDEPFAAAEVRRLEELWLRAAELAVEFDLEAGRNEEALAQLERLIEAHPLGERLHAQRVLALYRAGRQAEALEAYATARRRLVDGVGIEPGAELRELQARILRQDPSLLLPPPVERQAGEKLPPPGGESSAPPTAAPILRRRLLIAALVCAVVAAGVFAVTRLTGGDGLSGVAAGAVGVIDPERAEITTQYRTGAVPGALARGAGSVWVASGARGTVSVFTRAETG